MRDRPIHPIYIRSSDYVGTKPFENDLFEREALGEKLMHFVERMNDGCVFAIDAPWGDGKTWFGRNWESYLKLNKFKTIYLDAFQQDYIDDPFLLICNQILESIDDGGSEKVSLLQASKRIGKALLPVATKIAIAVGSRVVLGSTEAGEEIRQALQEAQGDVGEVAERYVEERLKEQRAEKESVNHFKETLSEFATSQEKPIIFIIDELDRCKPTYAVQTLERIKHFFDVPRLVFVLLINRDQIEASIKGVYGESVNAHAYLGKFVQFFLSLPKLSGNGDNPRNFNQILCNKLCKAYGLDKTSGAEAFVFNFSLFSNLLALSLRDVERAFVLYSIAQPTNELSYILSYLIALKLGRPKLFRDLIEGRIEAHREAEELTSGWIKRTGKNTGLISALRELHAGHVRGVFNSPGPELGILIENLSRFHLGLHNLFSVLAQRIELSVSN